MKLGIIVATIISAVVLGFWIFAPSSECQGATCGTEPVAKIAVTQAEQNQAYIFDVRTPQEFDAEHVSTATNFDVELLKAGQLPNVAKDSEVYVYCRSGNSSAEATQLLLDGGFTNVTDLGGLDNLRDAGVL